ncbi:glycosyltransferase family 4 protein [Mucilaginibacter glaciei]|uniref:Glycosyltransferase family 4 protein n=1 Tax=Mucilaginibacter glaciei TaxID=2772109 RepID=A0A926NRG5_9SPHI|nr:glycosyltransferase family 4 protein [Mucilaginibacter glaciei]MBD1393307.1 glycosyltransferase family 4 protein [Mucilaginibacter glaciei]
MKVVVSHPTGNANVRAALAGMHKAQLLAAYYTSIASFEGGLLDRIGAFGPLSEIRRRRLDSKLKAITHLSPFTEVGRLFSAKVGIANLNRHETGLFSIDSVYRNMDRRVAAQLANLKNINAVYAYEDAAELTFNAAKSHGLECLYDLPIGYWRAARRLLKNESERRPEWAGTLTTFKDSEAKLARKDRELLLADRIFVASTFTAKTLQEYPGIIAPVKVIPYGFPDVGDMKQYHSLGKRPLKLLFVGGLSQRKGIAEMFAAIDKLGNHIELTIVGKKVNENCAALDNALAKHKWIASLPHAEILKLMKQHDVLLFPSLFEGFGLVITEAMAQGTPVITTDRTAGPDIIEHGNNGWLINAGDELELQNAIENILTNRQLIANTGKAAMQTALLRPWQVYSDELAAAIIYNN